jgi:hypothetical protein
VNDTAVIKDIPPSVPKFGRLSHRTKFIKNMQASNFDQSAINNILGKKVREFVNALFFNL